MTNAKNKAADDKNPRCITVTIEVKDPPCSSEEMTLREIKVVKNMIASSSLLIFLIISNPPIRTGKNIIGVPIHHVAECSGDRYESIKTATAAGLNTCLFSTVRRYFEPIAKSEIAIIGKKFNGNFTGKIKTKIKAVIKTDSLFVTALKILENTKFAMKQITTATIALKIMSNPL
jgi:hypothetical protein